MDTQPWVQPSWEQHQKPEASAPPPPHAPQHPEADKNAIVVAWQWICYILWEATLLSLTVFLSSVLAYFITGASTVTYNFSIYSMAAVACLLPAAFFVDRQYRKYEPVHKHGFAGVVMVLNTVLVAIAVVGGVITAVFSLFSLLLDNESGGPAAVTIVSSVIVSILGLLFFARIVPPARLQRYVRYFSWAVVVVSVVTAIFALAGPVRTLISSRHDRLIENNLPMLNSALQDYISSKGALPQSLSDVSLDSSYQSGAKTLIKRSLVTYEPGETKKDLYGTNFSTDYYNYPTTSTFEYKLCVVFDRSKGNGSTNKDDIYSITTNHGSGKQCYSGNGTSYR